MLLGSALSPNPRAQAKTRALEIKGEPPSPIDPPSGCRFRPRCPFAFDRCVNEEPRLRDIAPAHSAACHLSIAELTVEADPKAVTVTCAPFMRGKTRHG